ncbi:hypothetical protein BJ742DRAFT_765410 [Cladochytrium replicatum]|nr:hypothetical protein BJ742DRAFT_765410 [Cladochytrium replicatum]
METKHLVLSSFSQTVSLFDYPFSHPSRVILRPSDPPPVDDPPEIPENPARPSPLASQEQAQPSQSPSSPSSSFSPGTPAAPYTPHFTNQPHLQAHPQPRPPPPPFARFHVRPPLGEGSSFLTHEPSTSRTYAVKIRDKKHIVREQRIKYVNIEKDVLNRMAHQFVVRLNYTFQDRDSLYFVLEYAEHADLLGVLYGLPNRVGSSGVVSALSDDSLGARPTEIGVPHSAGEIVMPHIVGAPTEIGEPHGTDISAAAAVVPHTPPVTHASRSSIHINLTPQASRVTSPSSSTASLAAYLHPDETILRQGTVTRRPPDLWKTGETHAGSDHLTTHPRLLLFDASSSSESLGTSTIEPRVAESSAGVGVVKQV